MNLLASVTEQQYSRPELAGLPEGWFRLLAVVVLAGLCYAVFWLYRREARAGASPGLRAALGGVRCLVLLLLAVIWLEPVMATYTIRTITAKLIVLVDVSASMGVVDGDGPAGPDAGAARPTRIERVARLLHDADDAWLRKLAARNELLLCTFGERTERRPLTWQPSPATRPGGTPPATAPAASPYAATQSHSDIGQALTAVLNDAGETPVAGILVLSDGIFNHGMSSHDAAAYARRFKAPIYAVGVGSPLEPPNVRLADLSVPATVAQGDPFEARVAVTASGLAAGVVQLELTARPVAGDEQAEKVVAQHALSLAPPAAPEGQCSGEARFELTADSAGEFVYRARVTPLPVEAAAADNQREARVLVLDERLRVLLVAGRPSYEYRHLTALLERDRTVDLSCWLQSADERALRDGDTVLTELPRRPEELFQYDALLLLDPDPRDLDAAWAIAVRRLVDEFGGGVLLQAGAHWTSRFLRDERLDELVAILPVVPDPDCDVRLSEQGAFRTRSYPFQVPDEAGAHPLLRLHSDAGENRALWEALPGVWWYLPVMREKPLAAVLLRHSSPAHATRFGQPVLLAVQPFGAGRTAFMACDSTWRWRSTGEQYFDRFWIQLVRYLAQPRRAGMSRRGTIVLDREVLRPGDFVKVEARVLDSQFTPWQGRQVTGRVLAAESERPLVLEAVPGRAGWFAGHLSVDWTGPATIRVPLPGAADDGEALCRHVLAEPQDRELRTLGLRQETLMELAQHTGGEYCPLDEAGALPERIANASQVRSTRGVDRPLWDKGWVLALIAALLGVEWTLRRRNHLL